MNNIPPKAPKKPYKLIKYDDVRVDNYYWLRERNNPQVIDYLKAENQYFEAQTNAYKSLEKHLFEEMKARIKQEDESVPVFENGYFYQTKFVKGKEYPVYTRRKGSLKAPEEIIFDVNKMASGYAYYKLTGLEVSPDNRYVVFGEDTTGRRQYVLKVKDLKTNRILDLKIENTTGSAVWSNDNRYLFYTKKDTETLRAFRIYRHRIGEHPANDQLIYEETDETFDVFVTKSKSNRFIYIASFSTLTTEYQILDADKPEGKFKIFAKRQRGVEYNLFHKNNLFYILTNKDNAVNFKLMTSKISRTEMNFWQEYILHRDDVMLEDVDVFDDFIVLQEREEGLNKLRILMDHNDFYIQFEEETYTVFSGYNPEMATHKFRYIYNSMTTPSSVIEFDIDTREKILLKEQEIPDGKFDKNNYYSQRIWVSARDGRQIPVSMVWHKDTVLKQPNPLLLYGYGAYGITVDPGFSANRLSLLDRGFVFAIAHIRGGEYLGRPWYEAGKLLHKKNSFNDFVDVANYLIDNNLTSKNQLFAMGGSAGGLLMGAVINQAAELFKGVVAQVPFVDVLTTMLDDSIPLTTGEYDEWGNPNEKTYYDYIKSYSPYDNIEEKPYPNMLVTTGLHDSQVQYWEPAKWVAKLREMKTDDNLLLLHTDMDSGHGGASGRFKSLKDTARDFAFIINLNEQA